MSMSAFRAREFSWSAVFLPPSAYISYEETNPARSWPSWSLQRRIEVEGVGQQRKLVVAFHCFVVLGTEDIFHAHVDHVDLIIFLRRVVKYLDRL